MNTSPSPYWPLPVLKNDDNIALIDDNIINLINLMELISFIERTMKITYNQEDYSIDNFSTINAIVDLVNKKCGE